MRLFHEWLGRDRGADGTRSTGDVPAALEQRRLLVEQREELEAQLALRLEGPLFVAVARQEPVPVEPDGFGIGRRVARPPGAVGRRPECIHVDPQAVDREGEDLAGRPDQLLARRRLAQAARVVQRLAQVRGGGPRPELRPERIHDLLAMQAVPWGECEQLHQGCRLALPPRLLWDRSASDLDLKPTEELDADLRHTAAAILAPLGSTGYPRRRRTSRAIWRSSRASTTKVRTVAPDSPTSASSVGCAFAAQSTSIPRKPSPLAARARIGAERSPTPPVKTSTSTPSRAAVIAAIPARRRCR